MVCRGHWMFFEVAVCFSGRQVVEVGVVDGGVVVGGVNGGAVVGGVDGGVVVGGVGDAASLMAASMVRRRRWRLTGGDDGVVCRRVAVGGPPLAL